MPDINTDAPILNATVDTDAPVLSASVSTDEPAVAANLDQLRYLVFEGKKGDTGDSAYEEAVSLGFVGTEAEWIASLKGEKGDTGATGATGATGQTGATGPAGEDGFSPTVTVVAITGGHRVTITDKDHPQGQSFDVMDGEFQTAVFGSTTASEIRAWINGGVPVRCVYDGREYWCSSVVQSGASSYRAVFACCDSALSGLTRTYTLHILDAGDTTPPTWAHYVVDVGPELPAVSASDNGKVLGVVNGAWAVKADETNVMTVAYNSNTNPGTIKDAVDHGYVVRCVYNNMEYFCSEASTSSAYFHALGANTIYQIALHWTNGSASWSNSSKAYPSASYTTPIVDGTAAVGLETAFARGDHVHPTDTSRLAIDGNAYRTVSIPFGECDSTSTSTAFTATVSGITELRDGVCVYLRNGVVTSAAGCTLNINGLGAKPIYQTMATDTAVTTTFSAGYTMLFVYNSSRVTGGCWDMFYGYNSNTTYSNASLGQGYVTCSTAESTVAKAGTLSSYAATTGGIVVVKFTNAVPANSTLNIRSRGAKAIYYKGAAITDGVIKAGDLAAMIYDGTHYHLFAIDRSAENCKPKITMASTDTTPTLNPNTLYVFPEMATLTPTLATPSDNTIVNEYHFIFNSGATPTALTLPATVLQPDGFTIEANKRYEVSILEGAMTAQSWAVTA